MIGHEGPGIEGELIDLPLREERGDSFSLPLSTQASPMEPARPVPATLGARAGAAAADAALVAFVVLIALLGAAAARDRWPTLRGLSWAALFAVYVSFFATVVPLVLFGRTVGMALSDLAAAPRAGRRRLALREAALRWTGTALTFATLGLSLLFTHRDAGASTLADALSGRPILRISAPPEGS